MTYVYPFLRLQELKSSTSSLVSDAIFDDPWTTALTDCLGSKGYVRVVFLTCCSHIFEIIAF